MEQKFEVYLKNFKWESVLCSDIKRGNGFLLLMNPMAGEFLPYKFERDFLVPLENVIKIEARYPGGLDQLLVESKTTEGPFQPEAPVQ